MKKLFLLLLVTVLIGCEDSKSLCDLPVEYENVKEFPEEGQLLGSYKILDDTSDFRIKLEKGKFSNKLKIIGNLPWCSSSDKSEVGGTWSGFKGGDYYSKDDIGVIIQPNKEIQGLGLGHFLIKKFGGRYSLIFSWYEGMETCDKYASQTLTCDFVTFVKE